MNKLTREKRDRLILIAIGTVVAIVGLWFGFIRSQWSDLKARREKVEKASLDNNKAQQLVQRAEVFLQELDEVNQKLGQMEETFASGDLYSWIYKTLDRFKASYKVEITDISQPQVDEVKMFPHFPYKAATYKVKGSAYYHDWGKFVADFENKFPYMRIQNVIMEPATSTNPEDKEKLEVRLELVALIK